MSGRPNAKTNDSAIIAAIMDRLAWDKRVSTKDVHVVIEDGNVMLVGVVDRLFRKQAAFDTVASVVGPVTIEDCVLVQNDYYRSDSELKQLIHEQLRELPLSGDEHLSAD